MGSAAAVRRHGRAVSAGYEDSRRRRGQLDPAECRRFALVLPNAERRLLLRRHVVQQGRSHRPPEVSADFRCPGRAVEYPEPVRPVALSEYRLCHSRLGIWRLFSRPESDHRPREQRDAGAGGRVDGHADDGKRDLPRDDGSVGGGDDQVPRTDEPGGRRLLLRLGHCGRRQRHAARRVHPAGTMGRNAQAALQETVRLDSCQHAVEGFPALLRVDSQPAAAFHRGRHRHPESRANVGRQHGSGPAKGGVRRPPGLLGRRMRHPASPGARRAGRDQAARQGSHRNLLPRRRLCVQPGPQHPGERAAREHHRHVRRGA